MDPNGFRPATIYFIAPIMVGDDRLESPYKCEVQIEGAWLHILSRSKINQELGSVASLPVGVVKSLIWDWPVVPPRGE
jgi:hypothetical protein